MEGDGYGFMVERGRDPDKVAIHQLSAIADGADPNKVFSEKYHVHHINENKWINGYDNLELKSAEEHVRDHSNEDHGLDLPIDKVVDMYVNQQKPTTEIADIFDCTPESIANYLRREGVELDLRDRLSEPWDDPDRIEELYWDRGMSAEGVADELGCCGKTIRNRMETFGIESR